MKGTDGHYYFVEGIDGEEQEVGKYTSGAEVFNRMHGVLTHTKCSHHTELPGQNPIKRTLNTNRGKFKRPQSAQVKTNKSNKSRILRSQIKGSKDRLMGNLSRPQTGHRKM
jgi:hypothetical protein